MPVPQPGEVLVQVLAAAINPSDAKNVLGKMAETKTPRVPGRDFAGRVVSGDSRWEGKESFWNRRESRLWQGWQPCRIRGRPRGGSGGNAPGIQLRASDCDWLGVSHRLRGHSPNGCGAARRDRAGYRDHGGRWVGCGKNCGLERSKGAGNRAVESRPRQAKRSCHGGMDRPRSSSPAGIGEGVDAEAKEPTSFWMSSGGRFLSRVWSRSPNGDDRLPSLHRVMVV